MNGHIERIVVLLKLRVFRQDLPAEDEAELQDWVAQHPENQEVLDWIQNGRRYREALNEMQVLEDGIPAAIERFERKTHLSGVHPSRRHLKRWLVAAAMVGITLLSYWVYTTYVTRGHKPAEAPPLVHADIGPGGNKATLTLADGSTVVLDSTHNGQLAQQGNSKVVNQNGHVVYHASGKDGAAVYNTMTTPRGGQYQLVLPDGSKVWLNAASSITYPTAFTGRDRRVAITGEAYLEVAADAGKPFKVSAAGETVTVLGTSFNINAYADETRLRTTLITGAVVVSVEGARRQLQPGQQVTVTPGKTGMEVAPEADLDQVLAWKNGAINFNGLDLEQAMRQLERWYDIEVVFEKGVPAVHLWGELGRNVSLKSLLKGLEESKLHYRIEEGRRLVVLP